MHLRTNLVLVQVVLLIGGLFAQSAQAQSVEWVANGETLTKLLTPEFFGGQGSRFTSNQEMGFGDGAFVRWEIDVRGVPPAQRKLLLPMLKSSFVWGVNQDKRRDADENVIALLKDGSYSNADFASYGKRLYLARLLIVDPEGETQSFPDWIRANKSQAGALLNLPGFEIVFRASKVRRPDHFGEGFGGYGGKAKEIVMPDLPGWRITELWVKDGRVVDTIVVHYTDGNGRKRSHRFGNEFNERDVKKFKIEDGNGIVATSGRFGRVVDRLCVRKANGGQACFGEMGGRPAAEQAAPEGMVLIGFQFRCGNRIDRIRPVWGEAR